MTKQMPLSDCFYGGSDGALWVPVERARSSRARLAGTTAICMALRPGALPLRRAHLFGCPPPKPLTVASLAALVPCWRVPCGAGDPERTVDTGFTAARPMS